MHFETENNFCQFSSSCGVVAQSFRMLVSSFDHLVLNLTGTKRHVGTCELTIVCKQGSFCSRSVLFVQRSQRNYHQAGFAHTTQGVGQFYLKFLLLFFCDSSSYVCASNRPKLISY